MRRQLAALAAGPAAACRKHTTCSTLPAHTLSCSCSLRSSARRAASASRSALARASSSSFSRCLRSTCAGAAATEADAALWFQEQLLTHVATARLPTVLQLSRPTAAPPPPAPHLCDACGLAALRLLVRGLPLLLLARLLSPLLLLLPLALRLPSPPPLLILALALLVLVALLLQGGTCREGPQQGAISWAGNLIPAPSLQAHGACIQVLPCRFR